MKKNLTLVALALAVLATVAVSPAMAANPFRVEVPFDFVVKGTALASGDYNVIVQDNGLVRVRSADGDRSVTVFTSTVTDREAQRHLPQSTRAHRRAAARSAFEDGARTSRPR